MSSEVEDSQRYWSYSGSFKVGDVLSVIYVIYDWNIEPTVMSCMTLWYMTHEECSM